MKSIKNYFHSLLKQMRLNDDIRQIQDSIETLNCLIDQNKSISGDTMVDVFCLLAELEKDLRNVTEESK